MNFIDYIKKHIFYVIICIALIIGSGFLLLFLPTKNPIEVESQEITLFGISLNNWGIWITLIATVLASIWAMYQYTKSSSLRQQEKSFEIAKNFSNGLLKKCSTLIAVYENSPLSELIKRKPCSIDFNTEELRELTNDDDFPSAYKKIKESIDFDNLYFRVLESRITTAKEYNEKFKLIDDKENEKYIYTTKEAQNLFTLDNSSFPFHFSNLENEVLNKLEYLCMNLSTHAAGYTYIYQSLHQIFFDTVETLSIEISIRNRGKYSDKFYTNIIKVYEEWQKIYQKSLTAEGKNKRNKKKKLNPKIKTVE